MVLITQDLIIFGAFSGLIANLPKMILLQTFYQLNLLKYTFAHIGSGMLVSKKFISHPLALILGSISDFATAMFFGIIILYIIRSTGNDKPIQKGIGIGLFTFVFFFNFVMLPKLGKVSIETPLANFLILTTHIAYGATCGWIINNHDNYKYQNN